MFSKTIYRVSFVRSINLSKMQVSQVRLVQVHLISSQLSGLIMFYMHAHEYVHVIHSSKFQTIRALLSSSAFQTYASMSSSSRSLLGGILTGSPFVITLMSHFRQPFGPPADGKTWSDALQEFQMSLLLGATSTFKITHKCSYFEQGHLNYWKAHI